MNGIDSNSADWLLVGFEDRLNMISGFPQTDEDFDDLIFAFRNTAAVLVPEPTSLVPEPASLALIGSAIVGFGVIRRRRNAS
jgi:PEP-CTERM motif